MSFVFCRTDCQSVLQNMTTQAIQEGLHVLRQRRGPAHTLARRGMVEAEAGGVQRDARRAATVRKRAAVRRTVVDPFATQRGASLAEVDAHLMCPPRLQATLDQRVLAQL